MSCADRYCFGSMPGREEIVVREGETPLHAIARHYLWNNHCPRAMGPQALKERKRYVYQKALEFGAEGVIVESMKFCEYWGYERAQDAMWLTEGYEGARHPARLPDRARLHHRRRRPAAHAVPGLRGVAGDKAHPGRA